MKLAFQFKHITARVSLAAVVLAAAPAFAEQPTETTHKNELPPIDFKGYWRFGYNTDINPLQRERDTQGTSVPHSRHVRSPSYFNLSLGKSFENGARINFDIDNDGKTPHRDGNWNASESADTAQEIQNLYDRDLRVRELYLELPVGDARIWAGARKLEFEDIRIFDQLNPFNLDALGIGATVGNTQAHLSVQDSTRILPGETETSSSRPLKDVSLLLRHELALGEGSALKPMVLVKQYGQAEENDNVDQPEPEVKGSTAFKVGAIYSTWGEENWGNMGLWFESNPNDETGASSGTDTSVGLMSSHSYEFGDFGVLAGLYAKYTSFKNEQEELKIADGKQGLEKDGNKKTNNVIDASFGLQPVYYATDHLHLALDLNYALRSKKLATEDTNAVFVTPIVRYAMSKNTLGSPQIYTSVTYGMYDWKAKRDAKNEQTDALLTTQTGFEVWF